MLEDNYLLIIIVAVAMLNASFTIVVFLCMNAVVNRNLENLACEVNENCRRNKARDEEELEDFLPKTDPTARKVAKWGSRFSEEVPVHVNYVPQHRQVRPTRVINI